jgi:peptidoglycan hydrolase-like protein with peptidoglycan-binding domain
MLFVRRLALVAAVAGLICAAAFAAGYALEGNSSSRPSASGTAGAAAGVRSNALAEALPEAPGATTTPPPSPEPTGDPTREPQPEPALHPGPRLLGPGDEGDDVRDLQARLQQIAWFSADVTGLYGDLTETAVRGFQAKREIPVTGEVDRRTLDRLAAMTVEPTEAELHDRGTTPGALDARCRTGRVLCVDKTSSTLRWVVDGTVLETLDVRFGAASTPTREGVFEVYLKDADHVSRLYGSEMPYSMFFSGGQAVHYSSDFAAVGYAGASHGCVNVRDYAGVAHLFDQVREGDRVVVYWS